MSNRETFREDPLLTELLKKLQNELHHHEGLIALDKKRYQEKIANATTDDDGINALEELLWTDPALAEMFGSMKQGKVAAKTIAEAIAGLKIEGDAPKFEGTEFPSYFKRKDGSTSVGDRAAAERRGSRLISHRREEQLFHPIEKQGQMRVLGIAGADVPPVQWQADIHIPRRQI